MARRAPADPAAPSQDGDTRVVYVQLCAERTDGTPLTSGHEYPLPPDEADRLVASGHAVYRDTPPAA